MNSSYLCQKKKKKVNLANAFFFSALLPLWGQAWQILHKGMFLNSDPYSDRLVLASIYSRKNKVAKRDLAAVFSCHGVRRTKKSPITPLRIWCVFLQCAVVHCSLWKLPMLDKSNLSSATVLRSDDGASGLDFNLENGFLLRKKNAKLLMKH